MACQGVGLSSVFTRPSVFTRLLAFRLRELLEPRGGALPTAALLNCGGSAPSGTRGWAPVSLALPKQT